MLFPSSVILSEASGGRTFPVTVGRAESKDLGGIFEEPVIKITLPSKARRRNGQERREPRPPFIIEGKSDRALRLRECFAFAPLRMTEF